MKKIYYITCAVLMLVAITVNLLLIFKKEPQVVDDYVEEEVCSKNCKPGDKIILSDTSWHIISKSEDQIVLFSDANIDDSGNFLSFNPRSHANTGFVTAFDDANARSKEKNPYCLFPDLGCSAYASNGVDVFEDSKIKKIIDNAFLPKIKKILNNDYIKARLLRTKEFMKFKNLEGKIRTDFLYYSAYWLMNAYNPYSVFVHEKDSDHLTFRAPYIHYLAGIRPVIEIPIS